MKCFIHLAQEAVAACKYCGKGMCANCSAYSNHSGVCPECRKKEFERELTELNSAIKWDIVKISLLVLGAILGFALFVDIVLGVALGAVGVFAVFIVRKVLHLLKKSERAQFLKEEISKLNSALSNGEAKI